MAGCGGWVPYQQGEGVERQGVGAGFLIRKARVWSGRVWELVVGAGSIQASGWNGKNRCTVPSANTPSTSSREVRSRLLTAGRVGSGAPAARSLHSSPGRFLGPAEAHGCPPPYSYLQTKRREREKEREREREMERERETHTHRGRWWTACRAESRDRKHRLHCPSRGPKQAPLQHALTCTDVW